MKSYFKHTSGEAFTLGGQDYVGFVHFSNGQAYTGKVDSVDMVLLEPKNTFMAQFYINQGNFNTTFRHIEANTPFFSNVNDLLNLQGMLNLLRHLNNNNLICFKNLILGHPTVYQFEKNNNFFYGLSSSTEKSLTGKRSQRSTFPFSKSPLNAFEPLNGVSDWRFLDNITTASFTVGENEDFVYFCSDGSNRLHAMGGNFTNPRPMEYLGNRVFKVPDDPADNDDNIYNIYNDEDSNQLYVVLNDSINIFNTLYFKDCQHPDSLMLIDVIPLGERSLIQSRVWGTTEETFDAANFTWNIDRTINNPNSPQYVKVGNNLRTAFENGALSCYNKYSNDLMLVLDLQTFNISALYSIDIRNTDDNIIMLYRHTEDVLKLLYIDPDQGTFEDHFLNSLSSSDKFSIRFSGLDSDMFYISTDREYQTRFLSAPEWPCGRLELGELHYPINYKWKQARLPWKNLITQWLGFSSEANSYFNLVSSEIISNNKMYMLHHNLGRIYAFNQPTPDRFLNALPLDTETNYRELACSESSLGLYFNAFISIIVRDMLILFSKSFGSFNIRERSVAVQKLDEVTTATNNLYLNGNETFNVLAIQRILVLVNDLQTSLLSKSVEN